MKFLFLLITIFFVLISCSKRDVSKDKSQTTLNTLDTTATVFEPKKFNIYGEILPNKGFAEAILAAGKINDSTSLISSNQMLKIINSLGQEVDMRFIKAGEKFKITFSKDSSKITSFEFYQNLITTYKVYLDSTNSIEKYKSKTIIKPTTKKYRLVYGVLDTTNRTLDAALRSADLPGNLTQTVNNIMICKVSFRYDARLGDSSEVLVEEKYYKDQLVDGTVLYASYKGKRAGFTEAFFYRDKDPKSSYNAYYTKDGRALVNNALRYPLDIIHVVSPFGMRIHPITGKRTLHNGVDLRGRIGTPVYAAARGIVSDSKKTKYGGNELIITHSDGTKSYYLHLSRRLVRKRQRVVARQLIGKVGATGRVTGPHLHFGIKTPQGKWVNPMKRRMIATPKLKSKRMKLLKLQMKKYLGIRDSLISI